MEPSTANLHGIIIVQEPVAEDGTIPLTTNNSIIDNLIMNSGDAGIEIQGDETLISDNKKKSTFLEGGFFSDCCF